MKLTTKSTKAEIYAAYTALQARSESQYITWPLLVNTERMLARETRALISDTIRLGAFCRKAFQKGVDTMMQPVLVKG